VTIADCVAGEIRKQRQLNDKIYSELVGDLSF
jgi:hypothetical protein